MGVYEPIFWLVLLYLLTPTMLTRWYAKLRQKRIFQLNLLFALCAIIGFYFLYDHSMSYLEKGAVVVLWSPLIFLILFWLAEKTAKANYRRSFILVNRYTQLEKEKHRGLDLFFTLLLYFVPLGLPLLFRYWRIF